MRIALRSPCVHLETSLCQGRYFNLSISSHTVRWAPPFLSSAASQSTRYFCCHFVTSGALRASHQRINVGKSAIGPSLVTLFGTKKNIVVQACCGHFPLCSTFSKNSTISPLVSFCQVQGKFWVEAVTSSSCFRLVQSRNLFQLALF